MARLLAFTYAGLTVGNGGSDDYVPTGRYTFTKDYERALLTFEVVVQNDDRTTFLTSEAALVTAYSTPDQSLVVVLGASTRHSFVPGSNTGFNARPTLRKLGGPEDTANSAKYECTVAVELPASLSGRAGRRSSTVNVAVGPSGRRSLTVSGTYTALSSNSARAQFEAAVDTYCNGVLSGLTGTWRLVGTPSSEADDQNKVIRFSRTYEEIKLARLATHLTANASIVFPRLLIRRTRSSGEFSQDIGSAQPLIELSADYEASVLFSETTDLSQLYEQVIRPYVVSEAERVAGGTVVVTSETPTFDPHENRVSATLTLMADPGSEFFLSRTTVNESIDKGLIFKPVYDGNPYSRDKYRGHASWVRTLTRTTVGRGSLIVAGRVVSDHGDPPHFPGFEEVREARRANSWTIGLPGLPQLDLRASSTTYTYVRADESPVSGSSVADTGNGDSLAALGIDPGYTGIDGGLGAIL